MESDVIVRKAKSIQGPKHIPVYLNGKLMNEQKPYNDRSRGNKTTQQEKDRFKYNEGKDFKPNNKDNNRNEENKEFKYSNKFQNRKGQNNNSRMNKFNSIPNTTVPKTTKETLLDKESIEKAKEAISKSEEIKNDTTKEEVVGTEIVEKGNVINKTVDEDILAEYGLTEDSFKEPEDYEIKKEESEVEEDCDIYEEY